MSNCCFFATCEKQIASAVVYLCKGGSVCFPRKMLLMVCEKLCNKHLNHKNRII